MYTGRQLILQRLQKAVKTATTADIQRAALFLERAEEVRKGCRQQRTSSRKAQSSAWEKKVDNSITWEDK
jgi:hypothetical protein